MAISLDYQLAGKSRSYRLPERTLAAKASSVVDVGEIITTGEPDAEGNVIPASVGFGGYQVRKVDVRADQTVTTEALVFDRRSKNFLTLYNTCCGITPGSVSFSLSSFTGSLGFIGTASAEGDDYCGGGPVELPGTFSSSNPAISSVSSGGNVSGVSPGSTFTNTSVAYFKQKTVDGCTPATQSNSAPTNVKPVLQITGKSYIFVGTDPTFASVNKYFATTATPPGGTLSATSSNAGDTLTTGSTSGILWISVKTTTQSTTNLDRTLTFKYTVSNVDSLPQVVPVTARQFAYATNGSLVNACTRSGWDYTIVYTPYTHPDHAAAQPGIGLDGTAATETFSPSTFSCNVITGNGSLDQNSQFTDHLGACFNTAIPACSSTHTQTLRVAGYLVRTNSLTISNTSLTYSSQGPIQ